MQRLRVPALLVTAVLLSCGKSAGPTESPDPYADAPYDVVSCPDMTPTGTAGIPLDRIPMGRVPGTFSPPLVGWVEVESDTVEAYALVDVDVDGNVELVTPIHASGSPAGGPARIWITDGVRACAPFDFTVQALPAAPGALADVADVIQEMITRQADALGTTPTALLATPIDELPAPLVPLAVMQSLVDDPDNPTSLAAIAAGTSSLGAAARLDLLEPLLARTDLQATLAAALPAPASPTGASEGSPLGAPARVNAATCLPEVIGNDAGLLDACMKAAANAKFEIEEGASGRVLRDMSSAFGTLGLVPGLGTPTAIAGFVSWLALNQKNRTAGLMPSTFTGMTIHADPTEYLEDEDGTGSWSPAEVTASNVGWDLGKEFIEALLQATSVAGAFDKLDLGGGEVDGLLLYVATNQGVQVLIGDGTLEAFQIQPEVFGPVDVTDPMWSTSRIAVGDAVSLVSHTDYEPMKSGTATLSVRTADGAFGGQQISEQATITVGTLQMSISPTDVVAQPDEPLDFTVTVLGSKYPEQVEIDAGVPLQGDATITYNGDSTHTVSYTAPSTPEPTLPDLLTVRHTAVTGARQSGAERKAIATIRFGSVAITTVAGCLEVGDTLTFEASVQGLQNESVTWSADVGTINPGTGLYTAPDLGPDGGTAVITVTSVADARIKDSVTINVGCACGFSVNLDGSNFTASAGDEAYVQVQISQSTGLPSAIFGVDLTDIEGGSGAGFALVRFDPIPIGATGTFAATVLSGGGTFLAGANDYGFGSQAGQSLILDITTNDGDLFVGTATGVVTIQDLDGMNRTGAFSASFQIKWGGDPLNRCVVG